MSSQRLSHSSSLLLTLVLLVTGIASAQSSDSKTKPTGTISGRVTVNDKGAADILVTAQSGDRPMQQVPARAKTDNSGRYQLIGLAAGQYQIIAMAPAMSVAEPTSTNGYYSPGKTVVLSSGEEIEDIDIKLVRGGVITGRVTDADGKPVIEQRLNLQLVDQARNSIRDANLSSLNYQMTQTDDRGIYRIYGLPAGRYLASVGSREGGFLSSNAHSYFELTFYGDTNEASKASIVELSEGGEATNIDIRVGHASGTFVATGRIVDADTGQPIPGVRLMYGEARPNQPFYGGFVGPPSGPRGEFRIEGLEPGHYGVSISSTFDGSAFYADPTLFDISDSDVNNLEVKATRGLTLSGVVVFEGSRAKELQQQTASLRIAANITDPSNPRTAVAASSPISADGSFHIGGARAGKVRLFVGTLGNSTLRAVTILRVERGGIDVSQTLEVQPGESISDLRVIAGLGNGTIRGTARFIGGTPPPNLYLSIATRREGNNANGFAFVDARGRFLISNLTAGTYEITLRSAINGGPAVRLPPPQKQTVNVTDDAITEVEFVVDLTPKEGGP